MPYVSVKKSHQDFKQLLCFSKAGLLIWNVWDQGFYSGSQQGRAWANIAALCTWALSVTLPKLEVGKLSKASDYRGLIQLPFGYVGTDWEENTRVLQLLAKFVIQTHPGSHLDPLKEHPQLTLRCWAVLCLCLRG